MKSKLSQLTAFLIALSLALPSSFAARTYIPAPTKKLDKASEKLQKMTENVKVEDLVKSSQSFFSVSGYEKILKKMREHKKTSKFKIDKIMHGEDLFYIRAESLKIVFRWVNKDNVAFVLNGHEFSYEEASKTELWQPKVFEVIKKTASKSSMQRSAWLNLIFGRRAYAIWESFSNPIVLGALGVAAVALITDIFYRKHKKEHEQNRDAISQKIATAKKNMEEARAAAEAEGRVFNAGPYENVIQDYKTLIQEYDGAVNDVGFFGYMFGNRVTKPAMYDSLMNSEGVE